MASASSDTTLLSTLVSAVDGVIDEAVSREGRGEALVETLRHALDLPHVALDVLGSDGRWERLASTPGARPVALCFVELKKGARSLARLELDGAVLDPSQLEVLCALEPILVRAIRPTVPLAPRETLTIPPMAIQHAAALWRLTRREREVLSLMVVGATNKSISAQLGCTEGTLEHHVRAILRKSGCDNRVALTATLWSLLVRT